MSMRRNTEGEGNCILLQSPGAKGRRPRKKPGVFQPKQHPAEFSLHGLPSQGPGINGPDPFSSRKSASRERLGLFELDELIEVFIRAQISMVSSSWNTWSGLGSGSR